MIKMSENEYSIIRLSKSTIERLKRLGTKDETYDDIINRLIKTQERLSNAKNLLSLQNLLSNC